MAPFNGNDPSAFKQFHLRPNDDIRQLLGQCDAPVALLKPVLDTNRSREFITEYPNSRLLFAYRHFGDVINSILKKEYERGRPGRRDQIAAWLRTDFVEIQGQNLPEITKEYVRKLWKQQYSNVAAAAMY